jgi:predicted signal transduction protein with EAL and GGDEF domain
VLVEVGERIKTCLRHGDLLARLGGDQFALLVHGSDQRGAEAAAARVLDVTGRGYAIDGSQFTLTCSIGITLFPSDGGESGELIRHAETAMQRAKQGGRAAFRFHQPSHDADLRTRMRLDHAMRQALTAQRFRIAYQPQFGIAGDAIMAPKRCCAGAIPRWAKWRWRNSSRWPRSPDSSSRWAIGCSAKRCGRRRAGAARACR